MEKTEIIEKLINKSWLFEGDVLSVNEEKALEVLKNNNVSDVETIMPTVHKMIKMINSNHHFIEFETEDLIKQADLLLKLNL